MTTLANTSMRIFLVEDSDSDALLLQRHLQKAGLVFEFSRGLSQQEALTAVSQGLVDVVITDYRLPSEDGLAIIRAIQNIDPDLPCILVSGQVGEDIAVEALHAGARDFVLKGSFGRIVPALLREHAETAIRRQRRTLQRTQHQQTFFLQTLLDTIPSPVFYKDQQGRYQGCNRAFEAAFGVSREDLQGKTASEALPPVIAQRLRGMDEALLTHPGEHTYRSEARFADGTDHEVVFFMATYANESHQGLVGTFLDITNLVHIKSELRQCEDRYQRILNVTQEGVLTTDKNFRLTYVNQSLEQLFGESAEKLIQRPLEAFIRFEDQADHAERKAERHSGKSSTFERVVVLPNGGERIVRISATPIMTPEGHFDGVFAMLTDISEQKKLESERLQMEVQLRHAQKLEAIGQLAAGIAHEINTPAQYIGDNTLFLRDAFSDLVNFVAELQAETEKGALPDSKTLNQRIEALDFDYIKEEIPRAIQQSLDGIGRVSKIVSAMKDFSHPGGVALDRIDLNRAIESTITVSRNEWKYVANLETDLDPNLPMVPCFSSEFNQAVLNILVNAAHAIEAAQGGKDTGCTGLIRVSTRATDGFAEVRISDSGIGIPKEIQAKVFDPFFTTKALGKGTGQGLSIARAVIVEKHGGSIEVISAPGEGTTFILRLPSEIAP
ncbi:MAG: PAS domain S-box protein [Holophaga sp.]|nr:PAS domain S-box protein [Holophaga sp.]